MKPSCVVVLSGGQDSTTCLFWAKQQYNTVEAISFDYGQKHKIELESARIIANMASVRHEMVNVQGILTSVSPLLDPSTPLEKYSDYDTMDKVIGSRIELTFVPMRNALFLTIATNYAASRGIKDIVTGVCQADNANYPDCTHEFAMAFQAMTCCAMADEYRIVTPLMNMSKAESVKLAHSLPGCWAALTWSHTSYDGKYPPTDNNHSNVLRAHGFEEAGLPDPLVLRAWKEGLMELPDTPNYSDEAIKVALDTFAR